MCTSSDYAAMKAAQSAIADAQKPQTYEDALIQQLKTGKSVMLTSTYFVTPTQMAEQEPGAYMTSDDPNPLPDQTDKVGLIADMANSNMDVREPKVALKEALKIQTLDDKF
ncbi:MAG: hypothetical protein NTY99_00875 [DPANN group archaeon]|nr:hypothetical protein [DPANN group archaeon]